MQGSNSAKGKVGVESGEEEAVQLSLRAIRAQRVVERREFDDVAARGSWGTGQRVLTVRLG